MGICLIIKLKCYWEKGQGRKIYIVCYIFCMNSLVFICGSESNVTLLRGLLVWEQCSMFFFFFFFTEELFGTNNHDFSAVYTINEQDFHQFSTQMKGGFTTILNLSCRLLLTPFFLFCSVTSLTHSHADKFWILDNDCIMGSSLLPLRYAAGLKLKVVRNKCRASPCVSTTSTFYLLWL